MKVALVYDRVNKIGGAERVLGVLHEIWPEAPLYTAVYNPQTAPWASDFQVISSFLQNLPLAKTHHEFYPWLTPLAFESFNFDGYDVVISVTSAEAKGVITKPKTLHICYCLTPTRYLWSGAFDYPIPFWAKPFISRLRVWDQIACQRPDLYLAISKNVQKRIKKYYRRESEVIYPPVSFLRGRTSTRSDLAKKKRNYFFVVSRLVPYKRIDIAVEAFNKLGLPLKIIGTGSEMAKLKSIAKKNIEFLGQLTDKGVLGYYQNCAAVIFPGEEDFGLVPLEVQACGRPVIAYKAGGTLETVVEGKTGEFFYPQTPEALAEKIKNFRPEKYKSEDCRKQAEKFEIKIFKRKFQEFVKNAWKRHQK